MNNFLSDLGFVLYGTERNIYKMTKILAIETSCDETAAAVIEDGRKILSDIVYSQADIHALYGGSRNCVKEAR